MASRKPETLTELLEMAERFRDERDWAQFHSPKNLAAAIAIEAAELQELFLWRPESDAVDDSLRPRVEEELADVLIHCANLASALGIDLADAVARKFEVNDAKYPVEKARGNARKYDELEADGQQ